MERGRLNPSPTDREEWRHAATPERTSGPGALTAVGALDGAGEPSTVRLLPDAVHTASAAAKALGVEVGQIANSLIFDADDAPLLVLTSGAHRVDTASLAASLGVTRLRRATPEFVRTHTTGQPIGGVAPLGHPHPLRTLVDTALTAYPEESRPRVAYRRRSSRPPTPSCCGSPPAARPRWREPRPDSSRCTCGGPPAPRCPGR